MPKDLTGLRVFIASPGGLQAERRAFKKLLLEYNEEDAYERGCCFIPCGWEETLGGVGRAQSFINEDIQRCDYFVLVLHDRWGTNPGPAEDGEKYNSGTHEEFELALDLYKCLDAPMRQIVVFFKGVDEKQISDPGIQLQQVLSFRKKIEQENLLFFYTYDEERDFEKRLRMHLAQWVRDLENGDFAKSTPPDKPTPQNGGPDKDEEILPGKTESTDQSNLLIEEANTLANDGRIVEAEQKFALAIAEGNSPIALNDYGSFLRRIGRLSHAMAMYERVLDISEVTGNKQGMAVAYGNMGNIMNIRGDLDGAKAMYRKSLEIHEKLGRLEGMAIQYGNLGGILKIQGDLEGAETLTRKSLEIHEERGDLKGMASQYGNLGIVMKTLGQFDDAEAMYRKALEINKRIGRQEGMANQFGNLGNILKHRGDLDGAEKLYQMTLEIDEKLGRLDSIARSYGSLGNVMISRSNLEGAEAMYRKALEINQKLSHLEGMANDYSNLGIINDTRGDLENAEDMYRKSLEINKKLGRREGMANQYGNLGSVAQLKGDNREARSYFQHSLELFMQIGMSQKAKMVSKSLEELDASDSESETTE